MDKSQITASIDFAKPGKQHGHLFIPYSYNLGGWANLMVPVTAAQERRRARPRSSWPAIMATNIRGRSPSCRLCRELQLEQIRGRVILIPCLDMPAVEGDDAVVAARRQELQPRLSRQGRRDRVARCSPTI